MLRVSTKLWINIIAMSPMKSMIHQQRDWSPIKTQSKTTRKQWRTISKEEIIQWLIALSQAKVTLLSQREVKSIMTSLWRTQLNSTIKYSTKKLWSTRSRKMRVKPRDQRPKFKSHQRSQPDPILRSCRRLKSDLLRCFNKRWELNLVQTFLRQWIQLLFTAKLRNSCNKIRFKSSTKTMINCMKRSLIKLLILTVMTRQVNKLSMSNLNSRRVVHQTSRKITLNW